MVRSRHGRPRIRPLRSLVPGRRVQRRPRLPSRSAGAAGRAGRIVRQAGVPRRAVQPGLGQRPQRRAGRRLAGHRSGRQTRPPAIWSSCTTSRIAPPATCPASPTTAWTATSWVTMSPTTCCATPTARSTSTRSGAASPSSRRASAGAQAPSPRCRCTRIACPPPPRRTRRPAGSPPWAMAVARPGTAPAATAEPTWHGCTRCPTRTPTAPSTRSSFGHAASAARCTASPQPRWPTTRCGRERGASSGWTCRPEPRSAPTASSPACNWTWARSSPRARPSTTTTQPGPTATGRPPRTCSPRSPPPARWSSTPRTRTRRCTPAARRTRFASWKPDRLRWPRPSARCRSAWWNAAPHSRSPCASTCTARQASTCPRKGTTAPSTATGSRTTTASSSTAPTSTRTSPASAWRTCRSATSTWRSPAATRCVRCGRA